MIVVFDRGKHQINVQIQRKRRLGGTKEIGKHTVLFLESHMAKLETHISLVEKLEPWRVLHCYD